jgi:hypothetical protein
MPEAPKHDRPVVSKVFYCGGSAGSLGVLRAVTPLAALCELLSKETVKYVGDCFPESQGETSPCTVIEITPEEVQTRWRSGFYRVEKGPLEFEELLRSLPE